MAASPSVEDHARASLRPLRFGPRWFVTIDRSIGRDFMVLPQEKVGDIKQGLPCITVAHPAARIAADPVVLREAGAQQWNSEALGTLHAMRVGDQQLGLFGTRGAFKIFEVADLYRFTNDVGQGLGARRRYGGNNFATKAGDEGGKAQQQIGIEGQGDTGKTEHEMRVDHRVLQLGALALQLVGDRLAGKFGQYLGKGIAGVKTHQVIEAEIRNSGSR